MKLESSDGSESNSSSTSNILAAQLESDDVIESQSDTNNSTFVRLLLSGPIFVAVYLIAMIPTYILPYFGSNSIVLNSMGAAAGIGGSPQFWMHLAFLWVLVCCAMLRGALIGRTWLPALPVVATAFDMLPGLNLVPFVPTVLHISTVVLGVNRSPHNTFKTVSLKSRYLIAISGAAIIIGFGIFQIMLMESKIFEDRAKEGLVFDNSEATESDLANTSMTIGGTAPQYVPNAQDIEGAQDPDTAAAASVVQPDLTLKSDAEIIKASTRSKVIARFEYSVDVSGRPFNQWVEVSDVGVVFNDVHNNIHNIWFGQVRDITSSAKTTNFYLIAADDSQFLSASNPDEFLKHFNTINDARSSFNRKYPSFTYDEILRYNTIAR